MADDTNGPPKRFDVLNTRGLAGKREYVRGLEQRTDQEALSLLIECLCDESAYLRGLAEDALLRMGDRAKPVLIPLLSEGLWFTRASVARVLGRLVSHEGVGPLLKLTEDANSAVADAARDALVVIGRGGGAITVARAIHALPADLRRRRFDELTSRDRPLGERIDRMLRNEELMSAEAGNDLRDDSPMVRASEEGLDWGVLTGAPRTSSPSAPTPGPTPGPSSPSPGGAAGAPSTAPRTDVPEAGRGSTGAA
jgi:HEAT repeat protein